MKVADYIASFLREKGISHIFGVYGAANGQLFESFHKEGFTLITPYGEQQAGFMAEGYTKATDNQLPGILLTTSGPGGHNAITPIANCYYDSIPLIVITGQVNSAYATPYASLRQVGFQETPITEIVRPITKYSTKVPHSRNIKDTLERAWFLSMEGRKGPVLIDIPMDIQRQEVEVQKLLNIMQFEMPHVGQVDDFIRKFLSDLGESGKPIILVGGGNSRECYESISRVANRLHIPVIPTWNVLGAVTQDEPHYGGMVGTYGGKGRNFAIQASDLLLAVGTRISGRITGGKVDSFCRTAKKYAVNIDYAWLSHPTIKLDEKLHMDAGEFWKKLDDFTYELAKSQDFPDFEWRILVSSWAEKYDPVLSHPGFNFYSVVREISLEAPSNAIIVADCGGNLAVTNAAWVTKKGQTLFSSNGNSPMGFSLCGAAGASLIGRPVYCIIGDGGLMINLDQILTPWVRDLHIILLENKRYGITAAYHRTNFGTEEVGSISPWFQSRGIWEAANSNGLDISMIDKESWKNSTYKKTFLQGVHRPGTLSRVFDPNYDDYSPRISSGNVPIEMMTPPIPQEEMDYILSFMDIPRKEESISPSNEPPTNPPGGTPIQMRQVA